MTCYHPLIRTEYHDHAKKRAADGHYYWDFSISKADKTVGARPEDKELAAAKNIRHKLIPCGNCIGCRLDYSRQWANRGFLEAKQWNQNWFVTITYDEEHITKNEWVEDDDGITWTNDGEWNGTLVPEELTQFIKNVRQIMKREYNQDNIRFMASGEYGEESARPHYHIIFFNLNIPTEDLFEPTILGAKNMKNVYYRSHIIERAWGAEFLENQPNLWKTKPKGICNVSEANWNTIAYTARYITKKINGSQSSEHYAAKGQSKEFFRVSRMPGIGEGYYQAHKNEIYENDEIIITNKEGTFSCRPPRYFDKLYKQEYPEKYKALKHKREMKQLHNDRIKDLQTSLDRLSQLEIEEATKQEANYKLIREFERKAGI